MTKGVSFVDENNNSSIAQKWDFGDRKREIIYPAWTITFLHFYRFRNPACKLRYKERSRLKQYKKQIPKDQGFYVNRAYTL